jgi:hypothetical protein
LAAQNLFLAGDKAGAIARLGSVPEDAAKLTEREPRNPRIWLFQAMIEMILGHPEDAVRDSKKSVEICPRSIDALDGVFLEAFNARILLSCGHTDEGLKEIARLLRTPGGPPFFNIHELEVDRRESLPGDPRMQAILSDPSNNAPVM